jgi:hypothetical protein
LSLKKERGVVEERQEDGTHPPRRWPGLRLTAAVRMAFDSRKVVIATAGLLLLQLGWSLLDLVFVVSLASADVTPDVLPRGPFARPGDALSWSTETLARLTHRLVEPAHVLLTPLSALFDPRGGWLSMLHAFLGLAWLIVVWGYCGGAIARITAIQEARLRQPGIAEAVRFAWKSGTSLILTPCCPLIGLGFCTLSGLVFGLIYRIPGGSAVAGALLFIPLAVGLLMTLLAAALIAGWPLFHAAVATGAEDALDALSRTYGYISQRLILFAVGIAIAWAAGLAGLALTDLLVAGVVRLTHWSLSLTGPGPAIAGLFGMGPADPRTVAARTHRFWLGGVQLLVHAWVFSYFWTAATLLYLWLRHEVDGTPVSMIDPPGMTAISQ